MIDLLKYSVINALHDRNVHVNIHKIYILNNEMYFLFLRHRVYFVHIKKVYHQISNMLFKVATILGIYTSRSNLALIHKLKGHGYILATTLEINLYLANT